MKRDMELIRKILFALEERESGYADEELPIEGYSEDEIGYHVLLMMEAGLVDGIETSHRGSDVPTAVAARLTWNGHEFLDASRSNTIWSKAKEKIKDAGGSVAFSTLMGLLKKLAAEALGIQV